MDLKLRYTRYTTLYAPEYSKDGVKWEKFTEKKLNNYMIAIAEALGRVSGSHQIWTTSTKELYFTNEICVSAFLGAAKVYFDEKSTEFEHLN